MHLYNLTLQPPTATSQAIVGNFSGAKQQEIIVSHGTRLELLRPDVHTGKVATVIATDVFGSIRSLAAFRLTGGTKGEHVRIPFLPITFTPRFLRLRNSRLRLGTHRNFGLRPQDEQLRKTAPRDVWEIWRASNCAWAVSGYRPQGPECDDFCGGEIEAGVHS